MPWAAASLLAAVGLSGCQAEETPPGGAAPSAGSTSASATSSPTSPSPSASPSTEVPAAAREKSEAGAEAFTRYFFEQVNVAWTEPRPGLIASLSDPDCEFCSTTEKAAAALQQANQRYESDPLNVLDLRLFSGAPEGQLYFFADLRQNQRRHC